MTPPSDNQTDTNPDFDKTVPLLHCDKHNLTYMETEGCPKCAQENGQTDNKTSG